MPTEENEAMLSKTCWARLAVGLAAVSTLVLAGCDGSLRRVPAKGTVMLDGKPLPGGIVCFNPDTSKGNMAAIGCMGVVHEGEYELRTAAITRSDSGPGLPTGWYKVSFRVNIPGEKFPRFPGPPVHLNRKYLRPETSPIAIEIVDDPAPGAYDIKLTNR